MESPHRLPAVAAIRPISIARSLGAGGRKERREVANFAGTVLSAQVIRSISEYGHQQAHRPDRFVLFIATLTYAAENRDWKQGRLVSVETITTPEKGERRYECVVSDITWSYTVRYEHPIKAPVHRPIKFLIEKDALILLDADGKERPAHIET
jgi:hypothetical protein